MSRIAYLMEEMSWTEVRDALRDVQVAIIPIGSHEQHGPYLAETCDTVLAQRFAGLVGKRMFPQVVVTPSVSFGVSFHHMTFPGTISFMPETLTCVLRDIVRSLTHSGIRKYLFLNGHGGNNATINAAAVSIGQELGVQIADIEFIQLAPQSAKKVASATYGHSCELEVSEALYLAPEIVKKELLTTGECRGLPYANTTQSIPKGPINVLYTFDQITANGGKGNALLATREFGKEIVDEALEKLIQFLQDFIKQ